MYTGQANKNTIHTGLQAACVWVKKTRTLTTQDYKMHVHRASKQEHHPHGTTRCMYTGQENKNTIHTGLQAACVWVKKTRTLTTQDYKMHVHRARKQEHHPHGTTSCMCIGQVNKNTNHTPSDWYLGSSTSRSPHAGSQLPASSHRVSNWVSLPWSAHLSSSLFLSVEAVPEITYQHDIMHGRQTNI